MMEVGFLQSKWLWTGPVVAVPALLHLAGRWRATSTPFPDLTLLRAAAVDRWSLDRWRRYALLIIRTLLLSALVLSLARPIVRGVWGEARGGGLLLLDASYSMGASHGGLSGFERGRSLARQVLESDKGRKSWGVIVFSDRIESSIGPGDPRAALGVIDHARLTCRGTDFKVVCKEIEKMSPRGGGYVLFSDGAAHGSFDSIPSIPLGPRVWVETVPIRSNAAVTGLDFGTEPVDRYRLSTWLDASDRSWTLRRHHIVEAQGFASWTKGLSTVEIPSAPGLTEFRLAPDALPADDQWYSVSRAGAVRSLLVVNGAPGLSPVDDETYFLRPLLEDFSGRGNRLERASVLDLDRMELTPFNALVLLNPPPLPLATIQRLGDYVNAGGGLWVTAGSQGGAPGLATLWTTGRLSLVSLNEPLALAGADVFPPLSGFEWGKTVVNRAWAGEVAGSSSTVLATERSKIPILSVYGRGSGRVAYWGTSIDMEWTNLPTKPAYPVLARILLQWVTEPRHRQESLSSFVGDPFYRDGSGDRPLTILRPDGNVEPMEWSSGRWRYVRTDLPGFYKVQEREDDVTAVNVDPSKEGDLRRGEWPYSRVPFVRARRDEILKLIHGRDLGPALRWLVILLLFMETALWFAQRRKLGFVLLAVLFPWGGMARGEDFTLAQLEWSEAWDPHPGFWNWGGDFLKRTTRLDPSPERRVVTIDDDALFECPFLLVSGRGVFSLSDSQSARLRDYFASGGFVLFDDSEASGGSDFSMSVRSLPGRLYPGNEWRAIPSDHAINRSFFLIHGPGGRRRTSSVLQGLWVNRRLAAVWSRNDLLGALVRAPDGRPVYDCEPGGEIQRDESSRVFVNIILFSVTGTYKTDAVHQPFIKRKLSP